MIKMYSGTIGSGKSYHALEDIVAALEKGKHVIANFPLNFTTGQVRRGLAERYMYIPDELLGGIRGIYALSAISAEMGWLESDKEGLCLLVVDEATNFFPKEEASSPVQKFWRTFMTQSRKFGYDITLIVQDDQSINKTISKCIEYEVKHRKANSVFPFTFLPFTLFIHVTYWKQQRKRLSSSSTIYVKSFGRMYAHKRIFADLDKQLLKLMEENKESLVLPSFGNCLPPTPEKAVGYVTGRGPSGEGPGNDPIALEGEVDQIEETHTEEHPRL